MRTTRLLAPATLDCAHDDRTVRADYDCNFEDPTPRSIWPMKGSEHWECDDCGVTFLGPLLPGEAFLD